MREFQKYDGDMQAALRGLQQEKLGGGSFMKEIDKTTRKRKWVASQEAEIEAESSKAPKSGKTPIYLIKMIKLLTSLQHV
jgi:hypothetical protein